MAKAAAETTAKKARETALKAKAAAEKALDAKVKRAKKAHDNAIRVPIKARFAVEATSNNKASILKCARELDEASAGMKRKMGVLSAESKAQKAADDEEIVPKFAGC